jgi:hypothetical protein
MWEESAVNTAGTLTVPLSGTGDDAWNRAFAAVDEQIGFVKAGESPVTGRCRPRLISGAVQVEHVREGIEDAVRVHLKALVQGTNRTAPVFREKRAKRDAEAGRANEEESSASAARMTERFRRNDPSD